MEALGWHVIVVWECELVRKSALEDRLSELALEITATGESKRMCEEMLRRQARLEAEAEALYPIPRKIKKESQL